MTTTTVPTRRRRGTADYAIAALVVATLIGSAVVFFGRFGF